MPKFEFTSNVRPSIFAYVPEIKAVEKDKVELVKTAVLSTTAKASARAREKEKEKAATDGDDAMATDEPSKTATAAEGEDTEMKVDGEATGVEGATTSNGSSSGTKKKGKDTTASEAQFENLPNLSRVVPAQTAYINFPSSSRYVPVRPLASSGIGSSSSKKSSASPAFILESIVDSAGSAGLGAGGGILVLKDTKPEEPVELVEEKARRELRIAATGADEMPAEAGSAVGGAGAGAGAAGASAGVDLSAPIAPMPEPFEYDGFED